jgi:hypothetical protein
MRRALAAAALILLAGCGADAKYDELKAPDRDDDAPEVTTTTRPDFDDVRLEGVGGTTTTTPVAIGPGPASIVGRVDGPDGPVGGATVQLERFVGDRVATMQVPTAVDGTWNAENVLGGRYRIRAWLAPSLGMTQGVLTFVDAADRTSVEMTLQRFEGATVDAAIAPSPPVVGSQANLAVRVRVRQVDAQGVVRNVPTSSILVTLTGSGSWSSSQSSSTATGSDGVARFVLQCQASGSQPLSAALSDGSTHPLDLPACVSSSG